MRVEPKTGPQIERFLRTTLSDLRPGWIVTIERKGTALLRTLVESPNGPGPEWKGWERVVSSKALPFVPASYFRSGIVLVLDDGIHSGHRITTALAHLKRMGIEEERIRVAVFAVHEKAKFDSVDKSWFGQLSRENYWDVRESVIQVFQQRGSLLLDTEHIEVPVEINCGRLEFFDALCRAGVGVEYVSNGGRHNLTIDNPLILDESRFVDGLPTGTLIRNVIRKIRVVEREKNWYAIIPIFYPSVPADCPPESLSRMPGCLRDLADAPELNSQIVSVYASTTLLQTAFACLSDLINEDKIRVCVPQPKDLGDTVSHLKAVFPKIDLDRLHKEIEAAVEIGRARGMRKNEMLPLRRLEIGKSNKDADVLTSLYWQTLLVALRYSDHEEFSTNQGASLFEIRRGVKIPSTLSKGEGSALLGTAIDMGIDEAKLVSDTRSLPFVDGLKRCVRVLKLDGEIMLSDVRRATTIWRFPYPPPVQWSPNPSWQ